MTIFVEDWAASYGPSYLVQAEEPDDHRALPVEDGSEVRTHPGRPAAAGDGPVAFVDGVRRGEASLFHSDPRTGTGVRGVAGAHACGAVLVADEERPVFGETRIHRLLIWGGGLRGDLPPVAGGWAWESGPPVSDMNPDAPLRALQNRMREAEGQLAEALAKAGYLTVVDGPLNFVRSRDQPVVGYIKTHHRALLEPLQHNGIPHLAAGERTSLLRLGEDRYTTYLRLVPRSPTSSPWAGIVRLEIPQSTGLDAAVAVADRVAGLLPRFAGIPHRDPRAPQNLQPIGALESHLRHLLGDPGLAARAVREAVAQLGFR